MKKFFKTKILLTALILCSTVPSMLKAQEENRNPLLPTKNSFMVEVNFTPFGEEIISFNQLQFRYWLADQWALRLGLAFNQNSTRLNPEDYLPSERWKTSFEENITRFGILPGIEFHFLRN